MTTDAMTPAASPLAPPPAPTPALLCRTALRSAFLVVAMMVNLTLLLDDIRIFADLPGADVGTMMRMLCYDLSDSFADSDWELPAVALIVAECTGMRRGFTRGSCPHGPARRLFARIVTCLATMAAVMMTSVTVGTLAVVADASFAPPAAVTARICLALIGLYFAVQVPCRVSCALAARDLSWPAHLCACGAVVLALSRGFGWMLPLYAGTAGTVAGTLPVLIVMTAFTYLLLYVDSRLDHRPEEPSPLAQWLGWGLG
ncbi:hypothetical protein [Bifidobacterium platyrrhinorum]|uniref:Uncharacterized protein n=1 Tax=Bifidobacterium platyrrhinorum TaxID=2661628 RepID=A0A6L9SRF2_9BIFI|nr:hypothetical protein [Bifidobacterium platyrrhinorum]NEG55074.1 hypothetical protein [Bifidobacterium platyrrhinorum]